MLLERRHWVKKKRERVRKNDPCVCTAAKQLNVLLINLNGKKEEVEPSPSLGPPFCLPGTAALSMWV